MNSDGWGGGYVTDVPYVAGYYPQQSPLYLNLACLFGGVAGLELAPGETLSYLELGCGQGLGALALAASNPAWRIVGVDFNPAHIAAARALAAEAQIDNARFVEADLAQLADAAGATKGIPETDIASLHGVWSWVGDRVRAGIVGLLADKVRPGGIVHVSYNALPAWQGAIGLQRLVRAAGERVHASSRRQAAAGFEVASALAAARAHHLSGNSFVEALIAEAPSAEPTYLAHEYMNAEWRPAFHADVAASLAEAKLAWVASANLLENFSALMLSAEAQAVAARFDDPLLRELVKDLCLPRGLRHDVFVRGPRPIAPSERDAALAEVVLGLLCPMADFAWEFEVPTGRAELDRAFFGPVVAALDERPRPVRELLELAELPRRDNPGELVGMLVGTHQALPLLAPPREPDPRVLRFNRVAARRLVRPDNLSNGCALAASGTAAPVPATMLDLFLAARLDDTGPRDPAGWAATLGGGRPPDDEERLRDFIERLIASRAPLWHRLGVLAAPQRAVGQFEPAPAR